MLSTDIASGTLIDDKSFDISSYTKIFHYKIAILKTCKPVKIAVIHCVNFLTAVSMHFSSHLMHTVGHKMELSKPTNVTALWTNFLLLKVYFFYFWHLMRVLFAYSAF